MSACTKTPKILPLQSRNPEEYLKEIPCSLMLCITTHSANIPPK